MLIVDLDKNLTCTLITIDIFGIKKYMCITVNNLLNNQKNCSTCCNMISYYQIK